MKYLFKGLIKCKQCDKNYNTKNNNGTINYICQTRKNRGKDYCDSRILKEDFLIYLIEKNRKIRNKTFNKSRVKQTIKIIEVNGNNICIKFIDGAMVKISSSSVIFDL